VSTPPFKALDCLQALVKSFKDHINELSVVRLKFDPVILNIGRNFAIFLNELITTLFILLLLLFFFYTFNRLFNL